MLRWPTARVSICKYMNYIWICCYLCDIVVIISFICLFLLVCDMIVKSLLGNAFLVCVIVGYGCKMEVGFV